MSPFPEEIVKSLYESFPSVYKHGVGHKTQRVLGCTAAVTEGWQKLAPGYTAVHTAVQTHLWPVDLQPFTLTGTAPTSMLHSGQGLMRW